MSQVAFFLDINRCTGCRTCEIACKVENGVEMGPRWRKVRTVEGHLAELVDGIAIDYDQLPDFPHAGVSGHSPKLVVGELEGQRIAVDGVPPGRAMPIPYTATASAAGGERARLLVRDRVSPQHHPPP